MWAESDGDDMATYYTSWGVYQCFSFGGVTVDQPEIDVWNNDIQPIWQFLCSKQCKKRHYRFPAEIGAALFGTRGR